MRKNNLRLFFFILISAILFSACSTTKSLGEDQYLLKKNTIEVTQIDSIEDNRPLENNLLDLTFQNPNSKILGLAPWRLWVYNATIDTSKKINRWINSKIGEPPVIYDSTLADRTAEVMEKYLFNKGYYHAEATYNTEKKKKKATVNYIVSKKDLAYIDQVYYEIEDPKILRLVYLNEPLLVKGQPYDVDNLLAERQRITKNLRNYGYYRFNKNYVYYEVDTLDHPDSADVIIKVQPPEYDSIHYRYFINNIYIYPDFIREEESTNLSGYDTVKINEYYIISRQSNYNPKALLDAVFFREGDLYKLDDHELTINRLTDLGVFSFVNIQFKEFTEDGTHYLDVRIELLPSKKQVLIPDVEAYGSTDFYGGDIGINYRNKNLFKYTDLFVLNVRGGIESLLETTQIDIIDFNADANLYFPKFLLPFGVGKINRSFNPKTRISLGYNFLQRLDYFTLQNFTGRLEYDWKEFAPKRHIVSFPVINYLLVTDESPLFEQKLQESPFLRRSFEDVTIIGAEYTYIFNNQGLNRENNARYFKANFDVALQYVKPDLEFRYYKYLSRTNTLAFRLFGGVGVAYGSNEVLPYIKQYVTGGPNSIRAFRIRSLGPGSYYNPDVQDEALQFIDQTGDVKLEANVEYRFDLGGIFESAFFVDAGNIWLLRNEISKPKAEFEPGNFYQDIAVGTGTGLRLDFSFFIIRLDIGIPIYDPVVVPVDMIVSADGTKETFFESKFVLPELFDRNARLAYRRFFDRNTLNYNLAIGYPF